MDFYKKNKDGEEVSVDMSFVCSGAGCSSLYEAMSDKQKEAVLSKKRCSALQISAYLTGGLPKNYEQFSLFMRQIFRQNTF